MVVIVTIMASITGGTFLAAAPASAANGCSGVLQSTSDIVTDANTRIGQIQLYWNSSTGTNCVSTVHVGPSVGVQTWTYTEVDVCATNQQTSCFLPTDKQYYAGGNYSYYVWENSGPSAHHCVYAYGEMDWGGQVWSNFIPSGHCA
jgi:hypothetical protein